MKPMHPARLSWFACSAVPEGRGAGPPVVKYGKGGCPTHGLRKPPGPADRDVPPMERRVRGLPRRARAGLFRVHWALGRAGEPSIAGMVNRKVVPAPRQLSTVM